MDHIKPALTPHNPRQAEHMPKGLTIFARIGHSTRMRLGWFGVAVDMNPVDILVRLVPALARWANHADEVALRHQRRCLQPDPAVKRHRQVFNHDQYTPGVMPLSRGFLHLFLVYLNIFNVVKIKAS